MSEIVVDLFAGGGGTSVGLEWAFGRSPDVAVNHDPEAVAMHAVNHPHTRHLCCDVREARPEDVSQGRPIGFLWLSPDCTFFSKSRGTKPFRDRKSARGRRGLAWVAVRYAASTVKPRIICLENVEEFADWGPLGPDNRPDPARRGLSFRRFVGRLRALGYVVEWRELRASDYGAPTIRKRLFLIARCDGRPIVWPAPSHGPGTGKPHRAAAECIDWSLPCPSIFDRKKPLAEPTLRRVARGIKRFVLDAAEPFIVPTNHSGDSRVHSINEPMRTITGRGELALVAAAHGEHRSEVRAFLTRYNGTGEGQDLQLSLGTLTTKDRFGLVVVHGQAYEIADIGLRMLQPRELYRAQGFLDSYIIDPIVAGKRLSKTAQVRMCGNSVSPVMSHALALANGTNELSEARAA